MKHLIEHWQLAALLLAALVAAVYLFWNDYVTPLVDLVRGVKERKENSDLQKIQDEENSSH